MGGVTLYGGALQQCRVEVNDVMTVHDGYQLFQSVSPLIPNSSKVGSSVITSSPLKVCLCDDGFNGVLNCSRRSISIVSPMGRTHSIFAVTVGQLDMPISSDITISVHADSSYGDINTHHVDIYCTEVLFEINFDCSLTFAPKECTGMPLIVNVHVDQCPNGFSLTSDDSNCICDKALQDQISGVRCDIDTGLITRPANYWIGPILDANETYNGFMWHPNCPNDYCKPENTSDPVMLTFSTSDTSDEQCTENRSGILCGACREGYSLTLTNFQCTACSNKHISLVLGFAIAGIALLTIVLALKMTVASGTINGLILYANIINVYRDIYFPADMRVNILSIFIAWVNLDLGMPTCFYSGLTVYAYAWLDYLFPLYLWGLIAAIAIGSKLSARVGHLFGSNPVAVLATVILMSFTKLLQTTTAALTLTHLHYSNGTSKRVWSYDGNITYFKGKHAILAL